jgi:thioredoxin-like negative regulator of GroEL
MRQEAEAAKSAAWWEGAMPQNMMQVTSMEELTTMLDLHQQAGKLVIVNFWAPWCQACKSMYPKLKQIAEQHLDVMYIKVNTGEEPLLSIAQSHGVNRLPYFKFYTAGACVNEFSLNLMKVGQLRAAISNSKKLLLEQAQGSPVDGADRQQFAI